MSDRRPLPGKPHCSGAMTAKCDQVDVRPARIAGRDSYLCRVCRDVAQRLGLL